MRWLVLGFLLFFSLFVKGNNVGSTVLTPYEKASLYHVVMKSPVLKRTIGTAFTYSGAIRFEKVSSGKQIDFFFIENQIVTNPSLLTIDYNKLRAASDGLIAEASVKLSLILLYKQLRACVDGADNKEYYKGFNGAFLKRLPRRIVKTKNDSLYFSQKLVSLFDPNITLRMKLDLLEQYTDLDLYERKKLIEAYSDLTSFVLGRSSLDLFSKLGGNDSYLISDFIATGDGSGSSGIFDDYCFGVDQNGRLGKGVGLFAYKPIIAMDDDGRKILRIKPFQRKIFNTNMIIGSTNIHMEIIGLNSKRKTTVVVNNGGNSYLFFASAETKELSPDSRKGEGATFFDMIDEFNTKNVLRVRNKLDGEKGLNKKLGFYESMKNKNIVKRNVLEKKIYAMQQSQKYENKEIKRQEEKLREYDKKIMVLFQKIARVEKDIIEVEGELEEMKKRLLEMRYNVEGNILKYKKTGDLYVFEDMSVFNPNTQDFQLKSAANDTTINVSLLGIGGPGDRVDEAQLNIAISGVKKGCEFLAFTKNIEEYFASDSFQIDSIKWQEEEIDFFEEIIQWISMNPKKLVSISLVGGGVCRDLNGVLVIDTSEYKKLRRSSIEIIKNENLTINISSFTDPIRSNLSEKSQAVALVLKHLKDKGLSDNDILSALRSFSVYYTFINRIKSMAVMIGDQKKSDEIVNKLNALNKLAEVVVKGESVSYLEYLKIIGVN